MNSCSYAEYIEKLVGVFNPETVEGLMCRSMVSVSWDGYIYDCDFNQMLELPLAHDVKHINDWKGDDLNLADRNVVLNQHCYS